MKNEEEDFSGILEALSKGEEELKEKYNSLPYELLNQVSNPEEMINSAISIINKSDCFKETFFLIKEILTDDDPEGENYYTDNIKILFAAAIILDEASRAQNVLFNKIEKLKDSLTTKRGNHE